MKDISKLIKKVIVNKSGHTQTVYVKADTGQEYKPPKIVPGKGPWIEHAPGLPDDTQKKYKQGGEYIPKRAKLHNAVVDLFLRKITPVPKTEKPIAVLMIGGPASGKSSIKNAVLGNAENFVNADADEVKQFLPEYRLGVENRARDSAYMVHEESSDIGKRIRQESIDSSRNLIIDGTGSNFNSYEKQINVLMKAGYHVKMVYADCTPQIAHIRAVDRAEKTGRHVPPNFIDEAYNNIPKNFAKFTGMVHDFEAWDTSGFPPKRVISGKDGKVEKLDEKWESIHSKRSGESMKKLMKAENKSDNKENKNVLDISKMEESIRKALIAEKEMYEKMPKIFSKEQGINERPFEI